MRYNIENLKGRDLITTQEWTKKELETAISVARELRKDHCKGILKNYLQNKTFIMLFYAPSTRTRSAFESAASMLGGHAQYIPISSTRAGEGEALKDLAKMYEIYGEAIGIRVLDEAIDFVYGRGDKLIREFADSVETPIINLADDKHHPTQAIGDMITIQEKFGDVKNKKYTIMWANTPVIRGRCSINAEALIATRFGMDVIIAFPDEKFSLDKNVMNALEKNTEKSGGSVEISNNYREALKGAHAVFPRGWCSNTLAEKGKKKLGERELEMYKEYEDWKLTVDDVKKMDPNCIVTHVLPVFRGYEAEDNVMDSEKSVIYKQAEDNMYAKAAALLLTMGGL